MGQVPQPPTQIDPQYAQTFNAFMQSPQVEQLIQQFGSAFQQQLTTFAQAIAQLQQAQSQAPENTAPAQLGAPPTGGNQPVGPLSQNPSPDNTSRISALVNR